MYCEYNEFCLVVLDLFKLLPWRVLGTLVIESKFREMGALDMFLAISAVLEVAQSIYCIIIC